MQSQGLALVINHLNPIDVEGADRIPPESVRGSGVKEPSVLITFFDATNLASLLPKGRLCLDGSSKGRPGVITQQHLAICKRTGLLEEIQWLPCRKQAEEITRLFGTAMNNGNSTW
jgi:hypothetical protein